MLGAATSLVGLTAAAATPAGTVDTSTLTGSPTGGFVGVDVNHWIGGQFTVATGDQITGFELAVTRYGGRFDGTNGFGKTKGSGSLVLSLWTATPNGLPNSEIGSTTVNVSNDEPCSKGALTEVDFVNPPSVTVGQKLFVALGALAATNWARASWSGPGASEFDWCQYGGSSRQITAYSSNQGSTWSASLGSWWLQPQCHQLGSGGQVPLLGFADYVTSGPPGVTPEAPMSVLFPAVGVGIIGVVAVGTLRRRRRLQTLR